MPSAPSISCAAKPIRMKVTRTAGSANSSVGMPLLHPVYGQYLPELMPASNTIRRAEISIRLFITPMKP
jgi:hypothetical protein